MNILLSAYACEPNKGSEPGVGWNWAIEHSKYNKVWVLTRDNNKKSIEDYLTKYPERNNDNLKFIYIGIPKYLTFWKKGRRGMRLFYLMWQYKAYKTAKEINKSINIDLIHHATFVSYTQPTFLYKLKIPMIWGPIAGGENIPLGIKIKMTRKEKFIEIARKLSQNTALITPCIRKTMKHSKLIVAATEETKNKIPMKYQNKTIIMPAIGKELTQNLILKQKNDNNFRIIMAGRLINWKAFDIGIKACIRIIKKYENVELYILGEGNKKKYLKEMSNEYLDTKIFFLDPVPHDDIYEFYKKFDIFLNTTLRDSGCMTMMEAMSVGLPCICINTGGPKILSEGIEELKIEPISYNYCVNQVSLKVEELYKEKLLREKLGEMCKRNVNKFSYENKIKYLLSRVNKNN